MGNKLFGQDISGLINKHVSPGVLDAVLTKITLGSRTSGSLTSGKTKTETTHTAKGWVEDYKENRIDGKIIKQGDRKISLIGDSIQGGVVPEVNDKVIIEGGTYTIVRIGDRDPAKAVYVCQGR